LDECLKQEMLDIALEVGARVGVYIRVDMFVAGGKSFIRTVQSIGRGLRLHNNKSKLIIYDICDDLKYSKQHNMSRREIYEKEKIAFSEKQVLLS
jgi:superfamily II DNA or RNA helicase